MDEPTPAEAVAGSRPAQGRPGRPARVSAARFDEVIHPATRLSIVALLAASDWVEFAFIRDQLALSDSALSKQLATLDEAGYVHSERTLRNHRRRVLARLTPAGRAAFRGHVAALQEIVARGTSGSTQER
jgi:DNA-binding MarR family transcriptional regulator